MGGNVTRENWKNDDVLGEIIRIIETPCEDENCACGRCMSDRNKSENEVNSDPKCS